MDYTVGNGVQFKDIPVGSVFVLDSQDPRDRFKRHLCKTNNDDNGFNAISTAHNPRNEMPGDYVTVPLHAVVMIEHVP